MPIDFTEAFSEYVSSRFPGAVVSKLKFFVSGFESEIYTFNMRFLPSGEGNYILRFFTGEGATSKLIREATGLSLLTKVGFPVPGLLLQEPDAKILGKPFEIIDRLDGSALWPALYGVDQQQVESLLARFGLLLSQLHKLDWRLAAPDPEVIENDPDSLLEAVIAQYRSLYTKYQLSGFLRVVDWLANHQQDVSVQPAIVHQDFHANNVLVCSNDQLYVIDWTQFGISDFRIDLCWTLLIMGDLGNPQWGQQIASVYASDAGPLEQLDYFNVIVYMKLLASTVIAYNFGPQEVGLREESNNLTREQVKTYEQLAERIRGITGLELPELSRVLANFSR